MTGHMIIVNLNREHPPQCAMCIVLMPFLELALHWTWNMHPVLTFLLFYMHPVQIEGVTPPSAESLPSQILEPETLLSEEGEDHREVYMYAVVPRVIT